MEKKIVAVLGDYYHRKDLAVEALEKALHPLNEENALKVEYVGVDHLVESLQNNPDAVVLFAENRLNPEDNQVKTWMDTDAAKAISQYVKNGGGWFAWHSGLASYKDIHPYTSMLKGFFEYHPDEHQVVHYFTDPASNLITFDEEFKLLDEHYFVHCEKHNTNVFLRSESKDGSSIAGWFHDYGDGRVLCLTPAHLAEGLLHPVMTKLLVESLRWGCRLS